MTSPGYGEWDDWIRLVVDAVIVACMCNSKQLGSADRVMGSGTAISTHTSISEQHITRWVYHLWNDLSLQISIFETSSALPKGLNMKAGIAVQALMAFATSVKTRRLGLCSGPWLVSKILFWEAWDEADVASRPCSRSSCSNSSCSSAGSKLYMGISWWRSFSSRFLFLM